jgi:hypothetical protein
MRDLTERERVAVDAANAWRAMTPDERREVSDREQAFVAGAVWRAEATA